MENGTVIDSTATAIPNIGLAGVLRIPAVRQIVMLVGVAGAVAAGLAVFIWSQTPGFVPIYSGGDMAEAAEIASALRGANIENKVHVDGSVLVDDSRLVEARMQLGELGITVDGSSRSLEEGGFGRSAEVEQKLLQQSLEAELARTISSLGAVREARVHLAMPRQSNFARQQKPAKASVFLTSYSGRVLDAKQAAAITQLVATAVPYLDRANVTIIDQHGRMLSTGEEMGDEAVAAAQLDYQLKLEEKLRRNLEEILTPLVGFGKVRVQVSADVDFSHREVAREEYDGANAAVVSRQTSETNTGSGAAKPAGVPGALTNQPPETGGEAPPEDEAVETRNTSRDSVENFEVPRTLVYEKPQPATIRRLSVAILVDDTPIVADTADAEAAAPAGLTPEEIQKLEALARDTVGFNEARGDTVTVTNARFRDAVEIEPVEPPAIWERPIVRDIAKQVLGAGVVLAIVFGVVRPMLRNVMQANAESATTTRAYAAAGGAPAPAAIPAPSFDDKVTAARNITGSDPARVAQVVKQWVAANE